MLNLSKTLSHLPTEKIKELETITERIVATEQAEIIILFGSYARGDYKEQRGEGRGKKSDYDILVITAERENSEAIKKSLRESFNDIPVPVQMIVEQIYFVNRDLGERHYFFTDIKREGKVLYDTGKHELTAIQRLSPTQRRELAEKDFKQWHSKGKNAFEKYKFCDEKDFLQDASFELQQVIEMCYTTIEMVFSHYNPYEHNLRTLRRRVLAFDSRVKEALPYKTEEQCELFDYLNFAYIGGRYRSEEDFPITKEQLSYWSTEAQKLLDVTEVICKDRIDCLRECE